jgi:hypothetical protein
MKRTLILIGIVALALVASWQLGTRALARSSAANENTAEKLKVPDPTPVQSYPACPETDGASCADTGCFPVNNCQDQNQNTKCCNLPDGSPYCCSGSQKVHLKTCDCGHSGAGCFTPGFRFLVCS